MGHNHKYLTNKGIVTKWVDAYIKGPKNAPWKSNRYLMLYKNFRHRLDRRGDEEIGTSLEGQMKKLLRVKMKPKYKELLKNTKVKDQDGNAKTACYNCQRWKV